MTRSVPLTMKVPFGGHERDVAEEDFLLLHVAQGLDAGFGVLVVDLEADRDLERGGVGHAALFALGLVVLQLQADGVAALVTEVGRVLVVGSAEMAEDVARVEGVGDDHVAAVDAGGAQVVEALEVAALALPVADGVIDELELRDVAEVGDGEDGGEDGLEAVVLALLGELVHLEEALVGAALHLDEVGDLDGCGDFGEVEPGAKGTGCHAVCHTGGSSLCGPAETSDGAAWRIDTRQPGGQSPKCRGGGCFVEWLRLWCAWDRSR